jgi:hypothetical protein
MTKEQLDILEEHAFYESGLSAHGCFEDLDDYAKEAIQKYGRIMIRILEKELDSIVEDGTEEHNNAIKLRQKLAEERLNTDKIKEITKSLYGVVLHVHELAKRYPIIHIGPSLYNEAYRSIKKYEECNYLNGRIQ